MREYIKQIKDIFGQQCDFRVDEKAAASPITHALTSGYSDLFRNNFIERLKRLDRVYSDNDGNRAAILNVLSRLALKRNWAGAFAELSAYDYLNLRMDAGRRAVVLNKIPSVTTLARYSGKGACIFSLPRIEYDDFEFDNY